MVVNGSIKAFSESRRKNVKFLFCVRLNTAKILRDLSYLFDKPLDHNCRILNQTTRQSHIFRRGASHAKSPTQRYVGIDLLKNQIHIQFKHPYSYRGVDKTLADHKSISSHIKRFQSYCPLVSLRIIRTVFASDRAKPCDLLSASKYAY